MRRASSIGIAAVIMPCLMACTEPLPPTGQVLLYVDTDAVVPSVSREVTPLFDRLRIEIYPPGQDQPCVGCSRELPINREMLVDADASIGIVPEPGEAGIRVRVRLYRGGGTLSAEPRVASTLETVVSIPEVSDEGIIETTVTLYTDDVAQVVGTLEEPVATTPGKPTGDLVGTWWGAQETSCVGEPADTEVCVPGGALWMGDPSLDLSSTPDVDGGLERLVVVSPFFIDQHEVTVAALRASGLARRPALGEPSDDPKEADTGIPDCTFTSDPTARDEAPVNCLTWRMANGYCESVGKGLPTEAQFEHLLSALSGRSYVWGEDLPECGDAIFGRGDACPESASGPALIGSGARDRLELTGGTAVDLSGNVSEWCADMWNREGEPCWGVGLFVDPRCEQPSLVDPPGRSIRGGHWDSVALGLRAAIRSNIANEDFAVSALVGFRCARSGN